MADVLLYLWQAAGLLTMVAIVAANFIYETGQGR